MPLDEKEKKALKERYKEHRQAIWSGKHSRKLNGKKKGETKTKFSAEQPTRPDEIENATSVKESKQDSLPPLADYEEQNQMIILRRAKGKKPVNEARTEKMPTFSERTTLYEPESTPKTEVKLSSLTSKTKPDDKTTMFASLTDDFVLRLERNEPQSNSASSSPHVAELSTKLEVIADTMTSPENILKEKIKSQRQEIWTGTSSQKKRQSKLKKQNDKETAENLGLTSAQHSQETKKGLTLGVVIIGIAAVVVAVVLGVLLGYLLA
ncbi:MAG: hypothetical protein V1897_09700 [Pseudomonadota bacterium]